MKLLKKHPYLIFIGFFTLLTGLAIFDVIQFLRPRQEQKGPFLTQKLMGKELWMTVFIHGTFHTGLGFLSYTPLINDSFRNSKYKYVMQNIRKDPLFYQNQLILELGLSRLEPTFDPEKVPSKYLTAYPIVATYQELLEQVKPGQEKNFFYTYGWSGFISKTKRRIEAIYFYNALTNELEKFKQQGLQPKLRIIAFSHGGNVALNLAAVNALLHHGLPKKETLKPEHTDYYESLTAMQELLTKLPATKIASQEPVENPYKHFPQHKNLTVDELIMLGVPIQPETDLFCHAPMFKKIFNFYSDEDAVQSIDWISSKRAYADQRFNIKNSEPKFVGQKNSNTIIQAQVLVGKTLKDTNLTDTLVQRDRKTYQSVEDAPWWKRLFYRGNLLQKKSSNPTHREFWFTYWKRDGELAFLNPFPVLVLVPLFISTLEKTPLLYDADVAIHLENEKLVCQTTEHTKLKLLREQTIKSLPLQKAQQKMETWRPDPNTKKEEFATLKKHVDNFLK